MAGLFGVGADVVLDERDPTRRLINTACLDEAQRIRAEYADDLATRIAKALGL